MAKWRRPFVLAAAVAAIAVSGCTSSGSVDDPVVRRTTWFSFMSGDDLRVACAPQQTRLRLVHNAIYDEDVRVIEAVGVGKTGLTVSETVFQRTDWSNLVIDPQTFRAPWRGEKFGTRWTQDEAEAVVAALRHDQAFTPLTAPISLVGQGFFWTATGCVDGQPWFHAWGYPSEAYDGLRFPKVIEPLLPSAAAFAVAHVMEPAYPDQRPYQDRSFFMTANADGISGRMNLPAPPVRRFVP